MALEPACEHCGRIGPGVQSRQYHRPAVIDAAQPAPAPADYDQARELTLCAQCDREARQPGFESRRWVEKQPGFPM